MHSTLTERAAHGSKQCLEVHHDKRCIMTKGGDGIEASALAVH